MVSDVIILLGRLDVGQLLVEMVGQELVTLDIDTYY
jgi:hypothetical protein